MRITRYFRGHFAPSAHVFANRFNCAIALSAIAVSACVPAAHAQFRASIQGTVSDISGAVVPGATVTLTDLGTGKVLTSTSDDRGLYNFNALPPDQFSIVVEKTGFQKKVLDHVELIPEQANAVNVQLQLGGSNTTVTVQGDDQPALDTETASVSGVISSNEVQHMPSFGRDVFQLSQLAPGSFGDGAQAGGGGTNNLPGNAGPGGSGRRHLRRLAGFAASLDRGRSIVGWRRCGWARISRRRGRCYRGRLGLWLLLVRGNRRCRSWRGR